MRKIYFVLGTAALIFMSACADRGGEDAASARNAAFMEAERAKTECLQGEEMGKSPAESGETAAEESSAGAEEAVQSGPGGSIAILLPEGWEYVLCPEGSERLYTGEFGIHFYPEGVEEGYVQLSYIDFFGVCGTGLEQEQIALAGDEACVGVYDGHDYWDFISFKGKNKGVVALTYSVEDWWPDYKDQVLEILDTLVFTPEDAGKAENLSHEDSKLENLGLTLEISDVTPAGGKLMFRQSGGSPTGDLDFGTDFVIERKENGAWQEVPVAQEGNYAFDAVAIMIKKEAVTEYETKWEWIYGELGPGEYRIGKSVDDSRGPGDYDEYMIYAYFVLD